MLVEDGPHEVVCQTEGFIPKKEYINPPYGENYVVGFTYMIGDGCSPETDPQWYPV